LKVSGVEVVGMIAIFTYGFPQASKAFDEAGVKLVTLTNYNVMIDIAAQQNKVSPDEMSTLMSWKENPAEWTGLSLPIK